MSKRVNCNSYTYEKFYWSAFFEGCFLWKKFLLSHWYMRLTWEYSLVPMQVPPVLSLVVWTQLLLAVWKCGESLVSFLIWAWHTCNQKMMKICRTSRLRFTFSTDYTLNAWCVRQVVSRSLIPRLLPCRKTGREPGRTDRVPVTVHLTSRWHHSYNRPFPFFATFPLLSTIVTAK